MNGNNIGKGMLACIIALVIQIGGAMLFRSTEVGGTLIFLTFALGIVLSFIKEYRPMGIGLLTCFAIDIIFLIIVFDNFSR